MKNFDPRYNDIPKTEIHIHLEGSIRTQTIIDIAREYDLKLPAYEIAELDRHVKVLGPDAVTCARCWRPSPFFRTASLRQKSSSASPGSCSRMLLDKMCVSSRCASHPIGPSTVITWTGMPAWRDCCAPRNGLSARSRWRLVILRSPPAAWGLNRASRRWIGLFAIKITSWASTWPMPKTSILSVSSSSR
jgi:hypothetical protein